MTFLIRSKKFFNRYREDWLNYLPGKQYRHFEKIPNKHERSILYQFVFWVLTLIKHASWMNSQPKRKQEFVAYVSSKNQLDSLKSTLFALREEGRNVSVLAYDPKLLKEIKDDIQAEHLKYSFGAVFQILLLAGSRILKFRNEISHLQKKTFDRNLALFLNVYKHYVVFEKYLSQSKLKNVLVSSDLGPDNRLFVLQSRLRGARSIYLQHASVSKIFPPLDFDFAFLDGVIATKIYSQCEEGINYLMEDRRKPKIFLTGQKKMLTDRGTLSETSISLPDKTVTVGYAVNKIDDIGEVKEAIEVILECGYRCLLRFHPGMKDKELANFRNALSSLNVSFSYPSKNALHNFLDQVAVLIAGDSSIHLEASLRDRACIYFKCNSLTQKDYYGFVASGLVKGASSPEELKSILNEYSRGRSIGPNKEAVRRYSATFGTEYEGREGELVAKLLISELEGKTLPVCLHRFYFNPISEVSVK